MKIGCGLILVGLVLLALAKLIYKAPNDPVDEKEYRKIPNIDRKARISGAAGKLAWILFCVGIGFIFAFSFK
jgi:hypothetical protein